MNKTIRNFIPFAIHSREVTGTVYFGGRASDYGGLEPCPTHGHYDGFGYGTKKAIAIGALRSAFETMLGKDVPNRTYYDEIALWATLEPTREARDLTNVVPALRRIQQADGENLRIMVYWSELRIFANTDKYGAWAELEIGDLFELLMNVVESLGHDVFYATLNENEPQAVITVSETLNPLGNSPIQIEKPEKREIINKWDIKESDGDLTIGCKSGDTSYWKSSGLTELAKHVGEIESRDVMRKLVERVTKFTKSVFFASSCSISYNDRTEDLVSQLCDACFVGTDGRVYGVIFEQQLTSNQAFRFISQNVRQSASISLEVRGEDEKWKSALGAPTEYLAKHHGVLAAFFMNETKMKPGIYTFID